MKTFFFKNENYYQQINYYDMVEKIDDSKNIGETVDQTSLVKKYDILSLNYVKKKKYIVKTIF